MGPLDPLRGGPSRLQVASDDPRKVDLGLVIDVQDAVLGHKGVELLAGIGTPGGSGATCQCRWALACLGAEAERVHTLGWHRGGHRPGDSVHHALQRQALRFVQLVHPAFDVPLGRDQAGTQQGRIAD